MGDGVDVDGLGGSMALILGKTLLHHILCYHTYGYSGTAIT